ncbi:hypothetical protein EYB53_020460 [Candidatus Chloroploca sp. M-50]|uniref:Gp5/Type VI secretion system Vgr protein OB-fold domain-containing protein n=1 Tax=Candidatus Chloroploca mongolica TaxID=2528176 RepID=A0ABS4DF80_9CHLR|nr:phage baseplate assembly protein V [Candidatus Chloroploca mongolica]MBP1468098.1 hypothetical protein [Candidatus Chloroploca mongolica]
MSMEQIVASLVEKVERRFYGKYRGLVVDNADPEHLGRLTLRVPSVLGEQVVTGWALPCVPYGGAENQGFLFIPEKGAGVWVEFEEGDLEFPIWTGTFWSRPGGTSELPKPNDGTQEGTVQRPPTRKIIKTLKGHTIQFEDADGSEMITIVEGEHGHVITMDKDGITITDSQNNRIILNEGNITLETDGMKVGSKSAAEPFILGKTFATQITDFLLALSTHTHIGNLGAPTSPPTAPIKLDVQSALSTKHMLDG